jgi:hypothetical protein
MIAQIGNYMTEEPNTQDNNSQIKKLLIDDPSNFQFHAAYMVYSETFDKLSSDEAKEDLNVNMEKLKENKIDVQTFYGNIAHHRNLQIPRQERFSMQTQRKKDWRKKSQRQERIKRHKK